MDALCGDAIDTPSFINTVSYESFGDVFNIAELEHCIIRPAMAKPSNFFSKFLLPSSRYPFALSSGDFRWGTLPPPPKIVISLSQTDLHLRRIHFAMNSGALHLNAEILIYTPQNLDDDRKSIVWERRGEDGVELGGGRGIKK